jgi:hypothetical protein
MSTAQNSSEEFRCAFCLLGRKKHGKEPKPVYLNSLLFHLTRKQKRQLLQHFPDFDCSLDKCHPACYSSFRRFAKHNQFFDLYVTCSICGEDIQDNEEALVPPCKIISHSLHKDCLTFDPNGCSQCRKGHTLYRDSVLRQRRKKLYLEGGWTKL